VFTYPVRLKKKSLTTKQFSSVACPTCGVNAGMRCLRYSGGLRFEPHLHRKLAAIEAIERKRLRSLRGMRRFQLVTSSANSGRAGGKDTPKRTASYRVIGAGSENAWAINRAHAFSSTLHLWVPTFEFAMSDD